MACGSSWRVVNFTSSGMEDGFCFCFRPDGRLEQNWAKDGILRTRRMDSNFIKFSAVLRSLTKVVNADGVGVVVGETAVAVGSLRDLGGEESRTLVCRYPFPFEVSGAVDDFFFGSSDYCVQRMVGLRNLQYSKAVETYALNNQGRAIIYALRVWNDLSEVNVTGGAVNDFNIHVLREDFEVIQNVKLSPLYNMTNKVIGADIAVTTFGVIVAWFERPPNPPPFLALPRMTVLGYSNVDGKFEVVRTTILVAPESSDVATPNHIATDGGSRVWIAGGYTASSGKFRTVIWHYKISTNGEATENWNLPQPYLLVEMGVNPTLNYLPNALIYSSERIQLVSRVIPNGGTNDIIVYRLYAESGLVDASWNGGGELFVSNSNLTESGLDAVIDKDNRLIVGGFITSREQLPSTNPPDRRDDPLVITYLDRLGPCVLGGQNCSCSFENCTYQSDVFVVAPSVTAISVIQGELKTRPGVTIRLDRTLFRNETFLKANSIVFNGGRLQFRAEGPGVFTLAQANTFSGSLEGIDLLNEPYECLKATPSQSGGSLSVLVTTDGCNSEEDLPIGLIVGVTVGAVVLALLVVLIIVLATRHQRRKFTEQSNYNLRQNQLSNLEHE